MYFDFSFQPKEPKKLSLKDASEGYIGKLQILRSGKARYGIKTMNASVLIVILTHLSGFSVANKFSTSELATVVSNGTPIQAYRAARRRRVCGSSLQLLSTGRSNLVPRVTKNIEPITGQHRNKTSEFVIRTVMLEQGDAAYI